MLGIRQQGITAVSVLIAIQWVEDGTVIPLTILVSLIAAPVMRLMHQQITTVDSARNAIPSVDGLGVALTIVDRMTVYHVIPTMLHLGITQVNVRIAIILIRNGVMRTSIMQVLLIVSLAILVMHLQIIIRVSVQLVTIQAAVGRILISTTADLRIAYPAIVRMPQETTIKVSAQIAIQ
jgi:hypothetical protein